MVDRAEEEYPTETLLELKERRRLAVDRVSGTTRYVSREAAREAVVAILDRARAVFRSVGPDPQTGGLGSIEESERWSREVLETIVPGHQTIVAIVTNNPDLATPEDREAAELLRLHAQALLEKHSGLPLHTPAMRFPRQVENIFAMDGQG